MYTYTQLVQMQSSELIQIASSDYSESIQDALRTRLNETDQQLESMVSQDEIESNVSEAISVLSSKHPELSSAIKMLTELTSNKQLKSHLVAMLPLVLDKLESAAEEIQSNSEYGIEVLERLR